MRGQVKADDDRLHQIIESAACSGEDPEWWFDAVAPAKAKRICNKCPAKELCLEEFQDEEFGIFGGLTPRERQERRWSA